MYTGGAAYQNIQPVAMNWVLSAVPGQDTVQTMSLDTIIPIPSPVRQQNSAPFAAEGHPSNPISTATANTQQDSGSPIAPHPPLPAPGTVNLGSSRIMTSVTVQPNSGTHLWPLSPSPAPVVSVLVAALQNEASNHEGTGPSQPPCSLAQKSTNMSSGNDNWMRSRIQTGMHGPGMTFKPTDESNIASTQGHTSVLLPSAISQSSGPGVCSQMEPSIGIRLVPKDFREVMASSKRQENYGASNLPPRHSSLPQGSKLPVSISNYLNSPYQEPQSITKQISPLGSILSLKQSQISNTPEGSTLQKRRPAHALEIRPSQHSRTPSYSHPLTSAKSVQVSSRQFAHVPGAGIPISASSFKEFSSHARSRDVGFILNYGHVLPSSLHLHSLCWA